MSEPVRRGSHYLQRSGRAIVPVGANVVPVEGPDWAWRVGPEAFERAFAAMAALGLDAARSDVLWAAVEPEAGRFDEDHLRVLDEVLGAARRHGLWLHPTLFVGGQVGDAFWDVAWREGRHPHADPELRRRQAEHAAVLARRWRGDPTLLAWDLTDEPPFWLWPETTDEDARAWTRELCAALRAADPEHLVTIGTSEQELGGGPFRADVVAPELDFATVHPYPIYHPELFPDALLAPRVTHAAAFETALAAGAGLPVMVHEYGASSAQYEPERIAAHDRLLAWSSLGRGAIGFFAWCWTDAEPSAFGRAPYVRQPYETQFGLTDWRGELRPRGRVLADLAATVRALDLDGHAGHGPVVDAAFILPHEYVRPYDPAAYGLSGASAAAYRPAEAAWSPRRSLLPLMAGLLNGYVLAARASLAPAFPRETLDDRWPEAPLMLLPAPLTSSTNSLLHVRTSFWRGAAEAFGRGAVAWVSCSAETALPEMLELLGCRVVDRAPADRRAVLRFVQPWGPLREGDELPLPSGDGTPATRGVLLAAGAGSEVVAVDGDGEPALVVARRGAGHAVVCSQPVELLLAGVPDAHGPADRSWGLYAGLAGLTRLPDALRVDHAEVTSGTLRGPAGGLAAVSNHGPRELRLGLQLPGGASGPRRIGAAGPEALRQEERAVELVIGPYDATAVTWDVPT